MLARTASGTLTPRRKSRPRPVEGIAENVVDRRSRGDVDRFAETDPGLDQYRQFV